MRDPIPPIRVSVNDELEYANLPLQVRSLAERVLGKDFIYEAGYGHGHRDGFEAGRKSRHD